MMLMRTTLGSTSLSRGYVPTRLARPDARSAAALPVRRCRWRSLGFAQGWVAQSHESRGGPDSRWGSWRSRRASSATPSATVASARQPGWSRWQAPASAWARSMSGHATRARSLTTVRAVRLSCATRRGADSAVIDRQPAALTRAR